jgi:serine/threonine protein kinase
MLSAIAVNGILGYAYDSLRDESYHLCQQLGSGTYGSVYRCVSGHGFPVLLKIFKNKNMSEMSASQDLCELVEREYLLNKFVEEQIGKSYDRRFFCYVDSMFVHHAEIESPRTGERYVGLHSGCIKFAPSSLTGEGVPLDDFCETVIQKITDPRIHTAVVLSLAELICAAVSALNERGVFHCDIKLSNILVCMIHSGEVSCVTAGNVLDHLADLSVKLIDFSLAQVPGTASHEFCRARNVSSDTISGVYNDNCYTYLTSAAVADPRSFVSVQSFSDPVLAPHCKPTMEQGTRFWFRAGRAKKIFKQFEMFAVACVVQSLFDKITFQFALASPPFIRVTSTMQASLCDSIHALLKEMTGMLSDRPSMDWCAVRFGSMRDAAIRSIKTSTTPLLPMRAPPSPPCAPRQRERRFRAHTHPVGAT